jgi:formamidopyrimidine-DNA glycosylase
MPELPEVEIARRNLTRWIAGKTIADARIHDARIVRGKPPMFAGRKVKSVDRRGKWLRIVLDKGLVFSHLGMTGKWVLRDALAPLERSERASLFVVQGKKRSRVAYLDPRLFGRLVGATSDIPEWTELGPDPLLDGIDVAAFAARLRGVKRTAKEAVLDQTILAGIGNIHASEALWRAKVSPNARTNELTVPQVRAIARGIGASIKTTIAKEDGPEITYVEEAGAPNPFRIYGHEGDPCPRCKRPLARSVLGGRATYYCPRCQR